MSRPEDDPKDEEQSFPCETDGCAGEITMYVQKYREVWECSKCRRSYKEPAT
jgi:hypothetical protein